MAISHAEKEGRQVKRQPKMSTNYIGVFVLVAVLALLVGLPLLGIIVGLSKIGKPGACLPKIFIGTGVMIMCACLLLSLLLILTFAMRAAPGWGGILARGASPEGHEYLVVQTFQNFAEPYRVSFYIRDEDKLWRWHYLEHEDMAWRSAKVDFSNQIARVSRNGAFFREIPLPTNTVDLATVLPGYQSDYCPSHFTAEDVLAFHGRRQSH